MPSFTDTLVLLLCSTLLLSGCTHAPMRWPSGTALIVPCDSLPDSDDDGLGDDCELRLAREFAPELRVDAGACTWDTSVQPARVGGEYYFGAQRRGADTVRIVYLPAYYKDCGYSGAQCALPFLSCAGHSGDSEFIAIDVARDESAAWRTAGIFLSAHCFDRSGGNCSWFRGDELARFSWIDQGRSAPVIWVASGKNANYVSAASCARGHWRFDNCADNENRLRYPIGSQRQNIGSRAHPAGDAEGCLTGRSAGWASRLVAAQARECFWNENTPFTGWQLPASGQATSYARYLREIAQF